MNLRIKYWAISDAGCTTKSDSSITVVRAGTASTLTIGSRFLVDVLNKFGFCSSYSEVQKYEQRAAFHQGTDIRGTVSLDHSWQ